jgi:thiol:disulfide interchange protein
VLILIVFVAFHTLILTRRYPQALPGAYYWGMISSVFTSMLLGMLLADKKRKIVTYLNRMLVVCLLVVSAQNFLQVNWNMNTSQFNSSAYTDVAKQVKMQPPGKLSSAAVYQLWLVRDDKKKVLALLATYPKNGFWLYHEAKYFWH